MPHDSLTAITARRLWGTQANWPSAQSSDEVFFVGAIGTSWLINGLGQRIAQINVSVPEFFFVYDEAGHLTGKYDGGGNLLQETVWLGDLPVAVLQPGGRFYIAPDHLGAPHQITAPAARRSAAQSRKRHYGTLQNLYLLQFIAEPCGFSAAALELAGLKPFHAIQKDAPRVHARM